MEDSCTDTGLLCLLLLARFYGVPADGAQLRHQSERFGMPIASVREASYRFVGEQQRRCGYKSL